MYICIYTCTYACIHKFIYTYVYVCMFMKHTKKIGFLRRVKYAEQEQKLFC